MGMNVEKEVREFLGRIGRKGGRSKSPAKLAAVRENLAKARMARFGTKGLRHANKKGGAA